MAMKQRYHIIIIIVIIIVIQLAESYFLVQSSDSAILKSNIIITCKTAYPLYV